MPNELLTIPGRVRRAHISEIPLTGTVDSNRLRNAALTQPEILNAMNIMFAEEKGGIDALIALFGGMTNGNEAGIAPRGMSMTDYSKVVASSVKMMNNHEFAWRTQSPTGKLYKFTRDYIGDMDYGKVGVNGKEFYLFIDNEVVSKDEVYMLADQYSQIMVLNCEPTGRYINGQREMKLRCRYMLNPSIVNDGCAPHLLMEGMESQRAYNLKPEASLHGSNTSLSTGDWQRGSMSTMRTEWNATGNAYHQPDAQWIVYTDKNGKNFRYWYNALEEGMINTLSEFRSTFIWSGKKAVNPDGSWLRDERGMQYISGDGLWEQNSKKLRIPYAKFTDKILETLALTVFQDMKSQTVGVPKYIIAAPIGFRLEFSKLMASVFKANPEPMYFETGGMQGVRNQFMCYHTTFGEFIIHEADYLSNSNQPSLYDSRGFRLANNRAFILNVSKMIGGQPNMMLVAQSGRTDVMGRIVGMANVAENGGNLTTPADVAGGHAMTTIGTAVMSSKSIIELYKTGNY